VYNIDSRRISEILSNDIHIQTTITSPPYYDMKDYGVEGQVGFGQNYQDYLRDLTNIFRQVYQYTKDDGTLWIIIDTFKRRDAIVPLPFDLSDKLSGVGWMLQNIIIWKKDKTVPWSGKGFTQRKFEYILLFSKSSKYKSNKDRVRIFDTSQLKKWWIKYPERYNPRGKALDEIWEYPIPIQGSWGKQYLRHFCPLPKEMVSNMIQISTDEKDIVFDPFAGSGTVLSQSAYMNRRYIGFELNPNYIQMFNTYLEKTLIDGKAEYLKILSETEQNVFEEQILNLRALKFGRVLVKKIEEKTDTRIQVIVERINHKGSQKDIVRYSFINFDVVKYHDFLDEIISKPPLSKFEIEPHFISIKCAHMRNDLYCYSITNSYSYMRNTSCNDPRVKVLSPIMVDYNESDYE
jgi:DNA modification methylase